MASISSTNSTSSLGNTSLRGFGGMASGIDRDAIIEKMTLGTTTKINNQKKKVTELEWKQEAYRGITDKILDWSDTYASYASDKNLKDPTIFSKSQITLHGKEDSKSMLTVNGSSDLIGNISILGVKETASSAVLQSGVKEGVNGLQMTMGNLSQSTYTPKLGADAKLIIETVRKIEGKPADTVSFTFKDSYEVKDASGKVVSVKRINYAPQSKDEYKDLVKDLNALLAEDETTIGTDDTTGTNDNKQKISDVIEFQYDDTNKAIKIAVKANANLDALNEPYSIQGNYVLQAFGYGGNGIELNKLNTTPETSPQPFNKTGMNPKSTLDAITGQKVTFDYNGSRKSIELITSAEAEELRNMKISDIKGSGGQSDAEARQALLDIASKYELSNITADSTLFELQSALNDKLYEVNQKLNKPAELASQKESVSKLMSELATKRDAIGDQTSEIERLKQNETDGTITEDERGMLIELTNKQMEYNTINDEYNRLDRELTNIEKQITDATLSSEEKTKLENWQKSLTGDENTPGDIVKVSQAQLDKVAQNISGRLSKAFGNSAVTVTAENGKLNFTTKDSGAGDGTASATLSVLSNDASLLNNLGVEYGASNKVNLDGKLTQTSLGLNKDLSNYTIKDKDGKPTDELDLEINGTKIRGLTKNSTVSEILSKINSTADAGVKATYVDATGKFMLVTNETGKGREINLNSKLAQDLFGGPNSKLSEGKNAQVLVSYGSGVNVMLERSTNTFNLEGLNVTVSGKFGNVEAGTGTEEWSYDQSAAVTFSAKADVDGALERVKQFIEDYNALVTEINTQVTTRPDSKYGALTDEQKDEMDETSIENWEKKAKQGILYGDSAMRDLSMDVQSIFTKMMNNGASYEDLKEIGISYAEDWGDGGTLVFDESKFKAAMENDPDKVSNIFTGGGNVKKGLIDTIEETFTPYATRYARKNGNGGKGSYGRLIEMAGTEKKPSTLLDNEIYKQLKEMQETIDKLQEQLQVEQDRYISQFTTMESLLNQMNTQSSYLSQLTA